MNLEGLQAVLNKQEVVSTVSASDLKDRTLQVEADYLFHVRTYLPLARAADGGEEQLNVEEFERRLIKQVKDGRAPRGYITAKYGYGKTTTALYLWQRAQEANLVVVPPFTLAALTDLLDGVYGWLSYKLQGSRPGLAEELQRLYDATVDRTLEQVAAERGLTLEQIQGLWRDRLLVLEPKAGDYIRFFEAATNIVLEAGYEGLVVMPDEIQQYFRARQKEGNDPIAPFFEIIQLLNARAAAPGVDWRFGFIMVVTLEELALIRDAYRRTDLLHRMKGLQIDLTSLYDHRFAPNLWDMMARHFQFEADKDRIADRYTLEALGEITARDDISDGPRTVINVFRRMVGRFIESGGRTAPYTPIDLITDFLDEQTIVFAGNDKIRNAVRRALSDDRVRHDIHRYGPAVKLAAAFPTNGVPYAIQKHYGLDAPLAELMQAAIGDVVRTGLIEQHAIVLMGLAPEKERIGWLPNIVREFRLGYNPLARITQERAEEGFIALLKQRVFTSSRWKVVDSWERSRVANASVVFEGAFDSFKLKFPRRRVHVRLLWEEEPVKDAEVQGDVCIEYHLSLYNSLSADERSTYSVPLEDFEAVSKRGNYTVRISLNLLYSDPSRVSAALQETLKDVWSPYELSPLVLLNVYQLLKDKLGEGTVPKASVTQIEKGFLPEVLDTVMRLLFNERVGQPVEAAGAAITEQVVAYMLETRYENYEPLIVAENWKSSLNKYKNALRMLEAPGQRQGDIDVEETKTTIATYFSLSDTGFDSFRKSFPTLIKTIQDFKGRGENQQKGIVRFTLHPLEEQILKWLRTSDKKELVNHKGKQVEVHHLNIASVMRWAGEMGYLEDEIEELIGLLQVRGLIEEKQGWLIEVHTASLSLEDVRQQLRDFERDLKLLADGLASSQLREWQSQLETVLRPRLNELAREKQVSPNEVSKLASTLHTRRNDLANFAQDQQRTLRERVLALQRVLDFPAQLVETLSRPLNTEVEYADQVNALMVALRREGERLQKAVEDRHKLLSEVAQTLQQADLSYDELARQARSMEEYSAATDAIKQCVERFKAQHQQFAGWRDLVMNGLALQRELANENPVDIVEIKAAFSRLSTAIRGEISSQANRLDALALYPPFAQQLEDIYRSLNRIKQEKRDAFEQLQRRYSDILQQAHFLENTPWRSIPYNPSDPRSAHEQVLQQAQHITLAVLDRIAKLARDSRQTLDSLEKSAQALPAAQHGQIVPQIAQLRLELETLIAEVHPLRDRAREPHIISDVANGFNSLVGQISQLAQRCSNLYGTTDELRQQVGAIQPTPAEAQLLDTLRASQDSRNAQDAFDIADFKNQSKLDEETLWRALRGLYDKNYVRVRVELKDN